MLFNGLPWWDVQNECASPSCLMNPYGSEMDVSFHGYPSVPTATTTTVGDASTCRLNPHPYPSLTLTLNQSTEHPSAAPPQTQPCILDPEIQ